MTFPQGDIGNIYVMDILYIVQEYISQYIIHQGAQDNSLRQLLDL